MDTALAFRIFLLSLVCLLVTACSRDTDVQFPEAFVKADVDCSIPSLSTPLVNRFTIETEGKDNRVVETLLDDADLLPADISYDIVVPVLADEVFLTIDVLNASTTDTTQLVNFTDSTLVGELTRQLVRFETSASDEASQLDDGVTIAVSGVPSLSDIQVSITSTYEFVEERSECQNLGFTRGDSEDTDQPVFREVDEEYSLTVNITPTALSASLNQGSIVSTDYGSSVSSDGRFIAVGAPLDDLAAPDPISPTVEPGFIASGQALPVGSIVDSGAVYLYERNGTDVTYCGLLKAYNASANDQFGAQVLVREGYLYVSAPLEDGGASGVFRPVPVTADLFYDRADSGAVYVYQISDTCVASEYAYIKNPENSANFARPQAYFGSALAEDAEDVFVGAPSQVNSSNDTIVEGAVYHFRRNGDTWLSGLRYETAVQHNNELFGSSLAVANGYLYVGAPGDGVVASALPLNDGSVPIATITSGSFGNINAASGAVQVFERNDADSTYTAVNYFKPSNNETGDRFGTTLDAVSNSVFIGAPFEDGGSSQVNTDLDDNSLENAGAVYQFDFDVDVGFKLKNYIKSRQVSEQAKFGTVLSAERRYLAVANPDIVGDFNGFTAVAGHVEIVDYLSFGDPTFLSVFEDVTTNSPLSAQVESMDLYGGLLLLGLPDGDLGGTTDIGALAIWE